MEPYYSMLYNVCLVSRQSIDRRWSIPSASRHRGCTSVCSDAVMKSILPLFVMTPEIWGHSHVSPLTRLLQLLDDSTWGSHTRKIRKSLDDHSSLRNVMRMGLDLLKEGSRAALFWAVFTATPPSATDPDPSAAPPSPHHATPSHTPFLSLFTSLFF